MNFNLESLRCFRVGPEPALLSLMSEPKFHFTSLMTVMGVLTSRTKLPNLCENATAIALCTYLSIIFVKDDIQRFEYQRSNFWIFVQNKLQILVIMFWPLVKQFLLAPDTAFNKRFDSFFYLGVFHWIYCF